MNTSRFTTAQLREALPILLSNKVGVTISVDSMTNSDLCELSFDLENNITSVDEDNGVVTISFNQFWDDDIPGFGMVYYYETLQTVENINSVLGL